MNLGLVYLKNNYFKIFKFKSAKVIILLLILKYLNDILINIINIKIVFTIDTD
jgi:hypothetical protein